MANLLIYFTSAIVILLIVAINMMLNPKTKKKGLFIFSSLTVLVVIRYFYFNYAYIGFDFFDYYKINDFISELILFIIMLGTVSSPFILITGFVLIIKGKKYRKLGIIFIISSILALMIGVSVCGKIHI